MTESNAAELRLSVKDGDVSLRFSDANASEWVIGLGGLSDYTDEQLIDEVAWYLDSEARDLAESVVSSLRKAITRETP